MRSQVWLAYIVATDRVAMLTRSSRCLDALDKPLQVLYSVIGVAGSLNLGMAYSGGLRQALDMDKHC